MERRVLATGLLLLMPICAAAQAADPATRDAIAKLLSRIDSLEKRVAELENEKSLRTPVAADKPAMPAAAPTDTAIHMHEQAPAPQLSPDLQPVYPSLKIAGFGDVNFAATNLRSPSGGFGAQTMLTGRGFALGQTTLHFSSMLAEKVSVFGELSFTARVDAGTGTPPATGFNAEVERLSLRYTANDFFKLSFGRFHTPINYWNTAFHHGQWLQTTISRPEMTQFGGSFIPVHFIGTLVEGQAPAGGLNLNYTFGIGNGRGQVISRGGDAGDINNNRAVLMNLFVKPNKPFGLQVGGALYRDLATPINVTAARESIESAYIVWHKESPEFIAEFANVTHKPVLGGLLSNSQAFYAQLAYRLPGVARLWKPYYRFEQIHVPRSDAIFRTLVPTFSGSTAGFRYDFSPLAAFKLEYRYYTRRDLPSVKGIFAQTSFTF